MADKVREARLWRWLKLAKKVFRNRLHMSRVENAVGTGMADVEGCLEGSQFWLELKCEARPKDPKTKIVPRFEPEQEPWHRRRRLSGGRAFVLFQIGAGSSARRYLLPGDLIPKMKEGLTERQLEALSKAKPNASATELLVAAATVQLKALQRTP